MFEQLLVRRLLMVRGLVGLATVYVSLLPAEGMQVKTFGEQVAIFEFERLETEEIDDYFSVILDISTKVFLSEMNRAPAVGYVKFVPLEDVGNAPRANMARELGMQHFVTGVYGFLRGNLRITAEWFDLERDNPAEAQALLGKEDLANFDAVEKKVRNLAQNLLEAYFESLSRGKPLGERLLVTCFSGAARGGSYLDSLITLELPFYLAESLSEHGVSPERFSVQGLTPSEYRRECEGGYGEGSEKIRYVLSGTVVQEGDQVFVKPLLFDQTRGRPLSILGFSQAIPGGKDLSALPSSLSDYLAERLRNILAQQRLGEEGFDLGIIDGFLGPKTREALKMYQSKHGLPQTGELDERTLQSLGLQ